MHIGVMRDRSSKRPGDASQLAKLIVDIATGDVDHDNVGQLPTKNPAAVALGRLGGLAGGKARSASLSADRRSEIARAAAKRRWEK